MPMISPAGGGGRRPGFHDASFLRRRIGCAEMNAGHRPAGVSRTAARDRRYFIGAMRVTAR